MENTVLGSLTKMFLPADKPTKDEGENNIEFKFEKGEEKEEKDFNYDFNKLKDADFSAPSVDSIEFVHPNDPSVWANIEKKYLAQQRRQYVDSSRYFRPRDLPVPPQVQQYRYNMANNYIQNRGYYNYPQLYNPMLPGQRWLPRYIQKVENKLNNPAEFAKPYFYPQWMNDRYDKYTGVNVDEMGRDNIYNKRIAENKSLYESQQNMSTTKINNNPFSEIKPQRRDPYKERRDIKVTPSIDPAYLDFKKKVDEAIKADPEKAKLFEPNITDWEGEPAFLLSAVGKAKESSEVFTPEERQKAYDNIAKEYKESQKDIRAIYEHPMDDGEEPEDYKDYNDYMLAPWQSKPAFNGYNRWNIPSYIKVPEFQQKQFSRKEMESGAVPIIVTEETKDIYPKKPKHYYPEMRIEELGNIDFNIVTYQEQDDGSLKIVGITSRNGKVYTEDEVEEKNKAYQEMKKATIKYFEELDKAEQLATDDCYRLANELSRYSQEAAAFLLWFRNYASYENYKTLHRVMVNQLLDYRNNDPYALVKSNVAITRDTILINKNDDSIFTDEYFADARIKDFKRITKYVNKETVKGKMDRAFVVNRAIQNDHMPKDEKIKVLRSLVNVHILPECLENWRRYKKAIEDSLQGIKRDQWNAYMNHFRLSAGTFKGITRASDFDKWWNSANTRVAEAVRTKPVQNQNSRVIDYFTNVILELPERERREAQFHNQVMQAKIQYMNSIMSQVDPNDIMAYYRAMNQVAMGFDRLNNYLDPNKRFYRAPAQRRNLNFDANHIQQIAYAAGCNNGYALGLDDFVFRPDKYQSDRQTFLDNIFKKHKRGSII